MKKILFALVVILLLPQVVSAQTGNKCTTSNNGEVVCLENPLDIKGEVDIRTVIGIIIKGLLGVIGSITLLMMVWGGFQWLTSAGNADKVESGKNTMIWAVIGVILVFTSYILVNAVTNYLSGRN